MQPSQKDTASEPRHDQGVVHGRFQVLHNDHVRYILMAQKLASQLGLGVGISSGANLLGALKVQDELGPDAVVVTMLCDSNKKYLSTDLLRDEPVKPDHMSPHVELMGFTSYNRVCNMCFGPEDLLALTESNDRISGVRYRQAGVEQQLDAMGEDIEEYAGIYGYWAGIQGLMLVLFAVAMGCCCKQHPALPPPTTTRS